jgi:murein DD-endopeptidase MepM/ murein hydrolase activator NlpD
MSEANTPAATTTEQTNGTGVIQPMSVEERADALFGPDYVEGAPVAPEPAAEAAPALPDLDEKARERAERRAKLAQAQASERERVDAMTAIRERDQLRRQLEEERERNKAYASHIDPSKLTKDQFFALAEKNPELTPHELGEWLRERMANPEAAAAKAARSALDPELAALRRQNEELAQQIQTFLQSQQQAAHDAAERAAEAEFTSFVQQAADTAPVASLFLARHGEAEFLKIARSAARNVPEHAGPQAVLDEIEEMLGQLVSPYLQPNQQKQARVPSSVVPVAQGGVTNTLAQQRSSVVDEDVELSKLPLAERAARVFG